MSVRTFMAFCLMSAIVHIALLFAVATPYQRQVAHGETMSVELVPSNEAPPAENGAASDTKQEAKPQPAETMPDFSKLKLSDTPTTPQDNQKQAAAPPPEQQKSQQQPQQQSAQQQQQNAQQQSAQQQSAQQQAAPQQAAPAQQPPSQPAAGPAPSADTNQGLPEQPKVAPEMAVETPADQYERLSALMNIPGALQGPTGYGTEADSKAKLTDQEVAQFKAHLKTCWKLPAGISNSDKVKVIIRIALRPDGVLADNPSLIEAAASEMGLPIYKNAVAALRQCAPYNMLPREKYKEWRVLDINFSPDEMARG